jgi:prevent-host-death family protein
MPEVGLRQLKAHASEILRDVREQRARYVVTHRGRPVAMLTPIDEPDVDAAEGGWDEFLRLLDDAAARAPADEASLQEIFDDLRR